VTELVLVTGGAGFIGSHTVDRLLEAGCAVRVLDSLHPQVHPGGVPPAHLSPEAELIRGDVRDLDAVRKAVRDASHVIHLAAETSVGQSMFRSDLHIDVNVRGTAMLFRALREEGADVERVVLSSSRAVYGEGAHRCARCGDLNPGPRPVEDLEAGVWLHRCPRCGGQLQPIPTGEDIECRYSSAYGMSKLFQEQVCRMEAAQLGIDLSILRYFNVYGPRQSPSNPYTGLIVTLSLRLRQERPLVLYEQGSPIRDFIHVDDVASANVRALTAPGPPERTLNVGSGRGLTLVELARELGRAFEREPAVEPSGRFRLGDIHAAIADIGAARSAIGFAPTITIEAGLRSLVPELERAPEEDRSEAVEEELRLRGVLRG
jgi:dTDP-L-rhamnose 4-epimerase